jgi:23S rRNA (adenine2503-C2)-methyltransferase
VRKLVFQDLIKDWDEASVLPLALREELKECCPLEIKHKMFDEGDTLKALIELEDGLKIESVLMKHSDNRSTVCVSSQVGCPLACSFCATGTMGLKRNLTAEEIVMQVLLFMRIHKVTNIVFMGMGEPFLNYDNVMSVISGVVRFLFQLQE